jgi:hypothetical protein
MGHPKEPDDMTHVARNSENSAPVMLPASSHPPAGASDGSVTNMDRMLL